MKKLTGDSRIAAKVKLLEVIAAQYPELVAQTQRESTSHQTPVSASIVHPLPSTSNSRSEALAVQLGFKYTKFNSDPIVEHILATRAPY